MKATVAASATKKQQQKEKEEYKIMTSKPTMQDAHDVGEIDLHTRAKAYVQSDHSSDLEI